MGGGHKPAGWSKSAFTLLEMTLVICIGLALVVVAMPAFQNVGAASSMARTTSEIGLLLEQARASAMASNTYVFVGFLEVDASGDPDQAVPMAGSGRVLVYVVASRDGTRGYNSESPADSWAAAYAENPGVQLMPLGALRRFENVHLAPSLGEPPIDGPMGILAGREKVGVYYRIGHASCKSVTPFTYPLGAPPAQGQYVFEKVICFDPKGIARIQYASNADDIKQWMEVGLQATNGNVVPALDKANIAAIQLDCVTGNVRVFKP